MTLTNGQMLQGRYRVVKLLGQGGMGAVYKAWDLRLKMNVALKEMVPQAGLDPRTLAQLRQQFEQEAVIMARLKHNHLVGVTDFFEELDNAYLVMEFVEGESLAERIERDGSLSEERVLLWANQLLDALEYCHSQGIIHRDISPQNVIIRPDGRAVLVDFGLVKLWDPRDPRTQTAMRGIGKPEYAPPEQYDTQSGHTDTRSDIYGLGATLYHALTGKAPPTATQRIVDPQSLKSVRKLKPRIGANLEAVITRSLELQPSARFGSAAEMARALGGEVPESIQHDAPPERTRTKVMGGSVFALPWWRRVPVWSWALGGVALLALVIYFTGALGVSGEPTPEVVEVEKLVTVESFVTATPVAATPMTSQSPPADASLGDAWLRPADEMVMVYVPAGEFEMGSNEGRDDEQPVHTVALDGFWIDKHEVTNAQFAAFLNEEGNQREGGWRTRWLDLDSDKCLIEERGGEFQPKSGYADHPVVGVSWYGARAYAEWVGGQLPSEAEWEYAARGPDGSVYPWGDDEPTCDLAQYGDCSGRTAPVGSFPDGASWCGALDMVGNVWEWTRSLWEDYPYDPGDGREDLEASGPRVVRGGAFLYSAGLVRCAYRRRGVPDIRSYSYGFRVVVSPFSRTQ